MIVMVTGSRDYSYSVVVRTALFALRPKLIRHGGCKSGADAMANEFALDHCLPTGVFEANWEREAMCHATPKADLCLAFLQPEAGNRGTRNCIKHADNAGLRILVWLGSEPCPNWEDLI